MVVEPLVALPLERLSAGRGKTELQASGPGRSHAPARALLGGIPAALLYLLHHSGVLLPADVSGAGALARLCHGLRRKVGDCWHQNARRNFSRSRRGDCGGLVHGAQRARGRRHLQRVATAP